MSQVVGVTCGLHAAAVTNTENTPPIARTRMSARHHWALQSAKPKNSAGETGFTATRVRHPAQGAPALQSWCAHLSYRNTPLSRSAVLVWALDWQCLRNMDSFGFVGPRFVFPSSQRVLLSMLLIFNGLDLAFTLTWVCAGEATEANELMATALCLGPVPFALAKLALVSGGAWVLFKRRHEAFAQVGLAVTTAVYFVVCCYHVQYLASLA